MKSNRRDSQAWREGSSWQK